MTVLRNLYILNMLLYSIFYSYVLAQEPHVFTRAKKYSSGSGINLTDYLVSEKYDGIRAYWDGEKLISRNGNTFHSPDWFTADFPTQSLDGELWIARSHFEQTVSIVTRDAPHQGWEKIKYMVFDLPNTSGNFYSKLEQMEKLINRSKNKNLLLIKQEKIIDEITLMQKLDEIIAQGGEGLMLRRIQPLKNGSRTADLLKVKKFEDAEATVLQHLSGKGKYTGMMGSIRVKDTLGNIFKIGSGFSDQTRKDPPAIGSIITFKHYGHYQSGIPRFPVFWRQRNDTLKAKKADEKNL